MNDTTNSLRAVACIRFVRPTLAEWTELQRRADNAVDGCVVHCVRSLIGWLRELYVSPTWSESHQKIWNHYVAALDMELRPNVKDEGRRTLDLETTTHPL